MLPAVPLPVVLSQMTSPDVEHLGVAEALPVDASEAVAAIVAADASTAVADSAMVRVACSGRSFGDRMVMFEALPFREWCRPITMRPAGTRQAADRLSPLYDAHAGRCASASDVARRRRTATPWSASSAPDSTGAHAQPTR
jgi:hypothetical protein